MNKTYFPKESEIKRAWYLVDAEGKTLGRLATRIAIILRGKHKPSFTPHLDTGDGVIVINASKIRVTGRKLDQKLYQRYSGYPGGLRQIPLSVLLSKKPEVVLRLAVRRMLTKKTLGRMILKRLKVYPGQQHPHSGQKPKLLKLNS